MSSTFRVPTWALLAGALLLAGVYSESAAAPKFDADGWHTWRVQSVDDSVRCCGTWTSGKLTSSGCNLDTGRSTRICDDLATSDEMQIYVKSNAGKVVEIRAFSPQCPVESEHKIHDLGKVDNAESVAWLTPYLREDSDLGEDAIAAIAAHAGTEAFTALRALVENRRLDMDVREQALFWLVQSDSDEAFDYLTALLTRP
jgi:hypothetical protein